MKSIMQEDKTVDYFTGQPAPVLEEHHIFFGNPGRKNSEKYGLKVYLTPERHRGKNGPHQNRDIDLMLKRLAQRAFERVHGNRELFMKIFGRNYL